MKTFNLSQVVVETVWATEAGYPAIINEISSSQVNGLVISPSGTEECSWNENGENTLDKKKFFNLKFAPNQMAHKYALIKSGKLISTINADDNVEEVGRLNKVDIVCKFSELPKHLSKILG